MREENNGVFLHCFGKHVVGYFEIIAWWYHSYSLRTLYVIDWTSFWHLLQAQKIQYNNKSALIYNFIIEMIFHPSWWSFPKREKVIEIGYSLWLQQKLYRVYSRLFRLVGWWQSSLGIKKRRERSRGWQGPDECVLKPTEHLIPFSLCTWIILVAYILWSRQLEL